MEGEVGVTEDKSKVFQGAGGRRCLGNTHGGEDEFYEKKGESEGVGKESLRGLVGLGGSEGRQVSPRERERKEVLRKEVSPRKEALLPSDVEVRIPSHGPIAPVMTLASRLRRDVWRLRGPTYFSSTVTTTHCDLQIL